MDKYYQQVKNSIVIKYDRVFLFFFVILFFIFFIIYKVLKFYKNKKGGKFMYYCLFTCDEWKSSSSMSLLTVTTDKSKLIEIIKEEILKGDMCYTRLHGEYSSSLETQASDFEKDLIKFSLEDNYLIYGYVETLEDGELR